MTKRHFLASLILAGYSLFSIAPVYSGQDTHEGTTSSWMQAGQEAIQAKLAQKPNTKRAKNVIVFVGDGMGISTLTAGRILEGQLAGNPGEENYLSFEKFPNTALVKTYNVNAQVADSAGTATAINTGTKTRIGVLNTAPTHPRGVCENMHKDAPTPLAVYAERLGMSTGIVSTARLTHATPAAVYAYSPDRNWETDINLPEEAKTNSCADIASQILSPLDGNGLEVALGGGQANFLPKGFGNGKRGDNKNITELWKKSAAGAAYITSRQELKAVDYSNTNRLLGLFSKSHMDYDDRRKTEQPELAEMTEAAIKMLSKNKKGYYLMVEAGRIDHGHHEGNAHKALHDTIALSKAVRKTLELVDTDETLILVTADHSHTFTIAGYPRRGNPILGLVSPPESKEGTYTKAQDEKPYTTLSYANGPGSITGERPTLSSEEVVGKDFVQQSLVPLYSGAHAGEDVALFAIGPWSHLAKGTIEQNVIFHIIDHALELRKRAK